MAINEITCFHVGQEFEYLGRTLHVTSTYARGPFGWYPALVCDYADNNGVIHNIKFSPVEADAIRAGMK
jgi:hypothetical protein